MTLTANTLHKRTVRLLLVRGSPGTLLHSPQGQNGDMLLQPWPVTPGARKQRLAGQGLCLQEKIAFTFS